MADGVTDIFRGMALYASQYGYFADGITGDVTVVIAARPYQSLARASAVNATGYDGIRQSAVVNHDSDSLYSANGRPIFKRGGATIPCAK